MSRWKNRSKLRGLVVTRREGEMITINNGELKLEVVEVRGRYVRLAFEAVSDISIQRTEALARGANERDPLDSGADSDGER